MWRNDPANKEHLQELGKKCAELLRHRRYEHNGIHYSSQSEAACGILFEKYLPGFKIAEGKTFQVDVKTATIDFLVEKTFIEWHAAIPTRTRTGVGDFATEQELSEYQQELHTRSGEDKTAYKKQVKRDLIKKYHEKRKAAIEKSTYAGYELITIQTPEELYNQVIVRFGRNTPSRQDFSKEFKHAIKYIKESNLPVSPPFRSYSNKFESANTEKTLIGKRHF
jgi:hypothetical protein